MSVAAKLTVGPPRRMLVAQIGARMHYAVPRIFHDAGILGALHTDICATKGWPKLLNALLPQGARPTALRRLFSRVPVGIPPRLIRTENDIGLKFALGGRRCRTATERTSLHFWAAEEFCRRVARRGLESFDSVYVFTSDGLEILEEAKRLGLTSFVEQTIPPREIVMDTFVGERERFPEIVGEDAIDERWRELAEREKREWELADVILCGSQFVLDGIQEVRGPVEKSVVVNYGVEMPSFKRQRDARSKNGPMNILFVGEVGYRKGAHYLIEAARRLGSEYHVRFCGPIVLPPKLTQAAPSNCEFRGIVPRGEMPNQYSWADVFCLPSLLEGSATVTYEAMAAGLPIVTTLNSGSLVRDGVDGLIVPHRDVDALVDALEHCRKVGFPGGLSPPLDGDGRPMYTLESYRARLLKAVSEARPSDSIIASSRP